MANLTGNRPNQNRLIVEGVTEQRVIPELMEKNGVLWSQKQPPVDIKVSGGYEEITAKVISANLKTEGLKALGLIIDADENPQERWQSIRNRALTSIDDLPEDLPETGLIHETQRGIRFGVWIWQNPPGRQLHQALKEKIFQPSHPHAQRFVQWFQDLYRF
ncbi:DUF3226 domain-containing protein [Prochlorothrix hollandica]|uniref:Uncharacterized protein n=1 Tax=Prochlorothrix hollandica PCC 9006 = CALU 1027 TaxID=317619 RepID=A0A0M2PWY8_PROHO|nr:DUF3226 domain-containing protein [Prochlorothrix hollandica]KKI99607.1 hypothetical protein PROH_06785 [Prochlorothrix hollandica PCC 9006 = CALU 1027]